MASGKWLIEGFSADIDTYQRRQLRVKFYRKRGGEIIPETLLEKNKEQNTKAQAVPMHSSLGGASCKNNVCCSSLTPTVQEAARPEQVCETQCNYPPHDPSLGHPRDTVSMSQKVKGAYRNFLVLKMHLLGAVPHEISRNLWERSLLAWWNNLSPRNILTWFIWATHPISTAVSTSHLLSVWWASRKACFAFLRFLLKTDG